jgi:hypothetical protein
LTDGYMMQQQLLQQDTAVGEVRSLMEASVRHFLIQQLASGDGPHFHQSI